MPHASRQGGAQLHPGSQAFTALLLGDLGLSQYLHHLPPFLRIQIEALISLASLLLPGGPKSHC